METHVGKFAAIVIVLNGFGLGVPGLEAGIVGELSFGRRVKCHCAVGPLDQCKFVVGAVGAWGLSTAVGFPNLGSERMEALGKAALSVHIAEGGKVKPSGIEFLPPEGVLGVEPGVNGIIDELVRGDRFVIFIAYGRRDVWIPTKTFRNEDITGLVYQALLEHCGEEMLLQVVLQVDKTLLDG
jgi:hypothetical protein